MSNIGAKLQIIAGCLHCNAQHNFSLNCKDISKGAQGSFTYCIKAKCTKRNRKIYTIFEGISHALT